ncbi:bifunctional tetrahydrofolate synthase/dihydrofolate synthase [Elongatibacter sediminis]|uniref:Dihydrofolate synthase/folylpolyglutamate synthase n=1 Tax=Elongatibacter sediminis TaxID=3119006 RepID=A0AAW9R739_9GAMM
MMPPPDSIVEWLRLLETRHPVAIDLGLERIGEVWDRLGKPRPASRLITVAGTNGKGSTVAFAAALLGAAGYRVGTYTSPHLMRYNERIRIAGTELTDGRLLDAFRQVENARGDIGLTYFEFGTLAAFLALADQGLDHAVLEVGLGGRLDAVNLLDADVSVITPIGLDHQEYLGSDLESIGAEKAGIIRAGRPVVCGESDPPESVLRVAQRLRAPVHRLGREFSITEVGTELRWQGLQTEIRLPRPPLAGAHQVRNLATAMAAVAALESGVLTRGDALARAIAGIQIPGRLQRIREQPEVLVDVGHNPLAAEAVAATLESAGNGRTICVLGMLRDKDAAGVAAGLADRVEIWHCCSLGGERGRSGTDLAGEVAKVTGAGAVTAFDGVRHGLRSALDRAGANDRILVFGSFTTAVEAMEFLEAG